MDQLIEFAGNHALLSTVFVALFIAVIWLYTADASSKSNIGPTEATRLINHENALVVDVRTSGEFKKGHIIDAKHVPISEVKSQSGTLEKDKQRAVVVCCRSGSRSAAASRALRQAGFENVYNLRGGMLAWESASLPVKRGNK